MPTLQRSSRPAFSIRLPRRQVLLFLVAVCLPCALLLALAARTVIQDRELAEKRTKDRRQRLAGAAAGALLDRLERIKVEEATAFAAYANGRDTDRLAHGATVFVGRLDSAGFQPPWPANSRVGAAAHALADPAFAERVARGMQAELAAHDFDRAATIYRGALHETRDRTQTAYAELLLARALRAGGSSLANVSYERVLRTSLDVRDEHGIPFALYAGRALKRPPRDWATLLSSRSLSPSACYALAELTAAGPVRERCAELDRVRMVAGDVALASTLRTRGARWVVTDSGRWLASSVPATSTHPGLLLAVRLDSVSETVSGLVGDGMRIVASADDAGEPIGYGIQGLSVSWAPEGAAQDWRVTTSGTFYVTALIPVLGVVLLGGWLLWRDVQRELRLAQLRSQFVASVSHELKTPLTSIRIFAETLRDRANVDSGKRHEYLETIARESERLTRLLQNVLDFSQIERGERSYHVSSQALPVIVERALRTLRFPLEQQGFTVLFHCDDDFALVRCDPDAVEQAVLNLVSNAIKYSGRSRRIDVRVEQRGTTVALLVRDYGLGISPVHRQRLFERFYRAPTPENDAIPGTGLGLTLVQHIAEAHGGRVTIDSEIGEGSTFTMILPATAPVVSREERMTPTPAPAAATS